MPLAVLSDSLIDGTGRDPLRNAALVVDEGKITYVGPRDGVALREYEVIEVGRQTVLPGLIDTHCHLFGIKTDHSKSADLDTLVEIVARALKSANDWLDQGVTTVRDLGTTRNLDLQLRDEIAAGRVRGPRILGSGRPLAMTGGLRAETAEKGIEINSADEARRAVRDQLRAGVDVIKLFGSAGIGGGEGHLIGESGWEQLTVEELSAAIFEAHKAGRRCAVHAIGIQSIRNALRAGTDTLEHGTYMDEECVATMKAQGTYFTPTLSVTRSLAERGAAMGYQPNIPARARIAVDRGRENVAMCHAAGVPISTGTDPVIADRLVDECRSLLLCGLPAMGVLQAATRIGAHALGLGDRIGTLEAGKLADLIVLDGNPLDDIDALTRVEWVMQGGAMVKSPGSRTPLSSARVAATV
jgi:imidazolonepropionase-like amidohydrolase